MHPLNTKKIFVKYITTAALIFAVPLTIVIIALYSIGYGLFSDELFAKDQAILQLSLKHTAHTVQISTDLSKQLVYRDGFSSFNLKENPREGIRLIETLADYVLLNPSVSNIFVHFNDQDYFFSNYSTLENQQIYERLSSSEFSAEEISTLLTTIDEPIFLPIDNTSLASTFPLVIPLTPSLGASGYAIFFIDKDILISSDLTQIPRQMYILNTYTLLDDLEKVDLKAVPSLSTTSLYERLRNVTPMSPFTLQVDNHVVNASIPTAASNLMILSVTSHDAIYAPLIRLNSLMLFSILVTIVLSSCFALFLFRSDTNPFEDFTKALYTLSSHNSSLKDQISETLPMKRQFLLMQVINGKASIDPEILEQCQEVDLTFDARFHSIFLINSNTQEFILDDSVLKTVEALQLTTTRYHHLIQHIYPYTDIYIVGSDSPIEIPKLQLPYATFYFGPSFESVLDVAKSYIEVRTLADLDSLEAKNLSSMKDLMHSYRDYSVQLQTFLDDNMFYEIPRLILLIIQEMESQNLPMVMRKSICLEVIMLFNNYFNRKPELYYDHLNLFSLYKLETYAELKEVFTEVTSEMLDLLARHSKSTHPPVAVPQIRDHINLHLADAQLSSAKIATYFYTSANYLDTLFLQETGLTLDDYVLKLRMEKARELLLNTTYSLKIISEQIGFPHISSFISTFKLHYSQTPGQYRNSYQQQK